MKRIALVFLFSFAALLLGAQEMKHFNISATEFYCFNNKKTSEEVSFGYNFKPCGVKMNVDWLNMGFDKRIMGESVSVVVPAMEKVSSFAIVPELGLGVAHGKFENANASAKFQFQAGVEGSYFLHENFSAGFVLKYVRITEYNPMWLLGFKFCARF